MVITRRDPAFTLIELLVTAGILSLLAAIAVPNFLEAQTRAKVTAAKANLRTTAEAIEVYATDHNAIPPSTPIIPGDPLAILADHQLAILTSPIAYLASGSAFGDPFGTARIFPAGRESPGGSPEPFAPNESRSLLYFHYPSVAERLDNPLLALPGYGLVSIGPDLTDSMGAYSALSPGAFRSALMYSQVSHPIDTLYDPTNGTASTGDVVRLRIEGLATPP